MLVKLTVAAAAAAAAYAVYKKLNRRKAPSSVKLTYFNIEGAAERVRLALVVTETPFEDDRIDFKDWPELKKKIKYGQLPVMTIDGKEVYQSGAMLRYVASLGDGWLYPTCDPEKCIQIDEMIGLSDDIARAWMPALFMGMGRHTAYGYPAEFPGKEATTKAMREKFVKEDLPRFLGYIADALKSSGGPFVCGSTVTIADLQLLPQIRYFGRGVADHVPKESLDSSPEVKAWIEAVLAVPAIKEWYASKL